MLLLVACGASTTPTGAPLDAVTVDLPVDAAQELPDGMDVPVEDRAVPEELPVVVDRPPVVDVPVSMFDVPPGSQPFRAPCDQDLQCMSGICVRTPGLTPGCGMPCTRPADCTRLGGRFNCAVDWAPGDGRFVCAEVSGPDGSAAGVNGDPCVANTDCLSHLCADGLCHEACTSDAGCVPGWRCRPLGLGRRSPTVCWAPPVSGLVVEDFELFQGPVSVDRGTEPLFLVVPRDVVSVTFVAQDIVGRDLFAVVPRIVLANGSALVDSRTFNPLMDQPVREIFLERQINSVLVPSSDTLRPPPGPYTAVFALLNDRMAMTTVATRRMRAMVRVKRAPGGMFPAGTLRVRIYLTGLAAGAPTAATAAANARLQSALGTAARILAMVGIRVDWTGYADVAAPEAGRLAVIDSRQELEDLLTLSGSSMGDVLNVFLVRGIATSAGLEGAIGVAGDLGGPAGVHGTVHSGVVAGWETTQGGGGRDVLPQTIAHEIGHYLGLWHTRERLPPCTSAGQTMCAPFGGTDPIADTPADAAGASRYLMYWATDGGNTLLSPGEGVVMRAHALVQ